MIIRTRCILAVVLVAGLWAAGSPVLRAQAVEQKAQQAGAAQGQRSFQEWKAACEKLPSNRALKGGWPRKEVLPLRRFAEFDRLLTDFFTLSKTGVLAQATNWVGAPPVESEFFNTGTAYFLRSRTSPNSPALPFQPFAQKVSVPEGSEIYVRADLHGDVRSLMANLVWLNEQGYLQGFDIVRTNFYMVFLGDYTDRGAYGLEVLYTLLRLKLANPERVLLLRGNHEDVNLQTRYGFVDEGRSKYATEFQPYKIPRAFDFFPTVIYLGSEKDFIQCNHGGVEPGYRPHALLEAPGATRFEFLGTLQQQKFFAEHPNWFTAPDARQAARQYLRDFRPESPTEPTVLGFMWNDFAVTANEPQFVLDTGRAFVHGPQSTRFLLEAAGTAEKKVHAIFRGHQHSSILNPMMRRLVASKGIVRLWQPADTAALANAPVSRLAQVLERSEYRSIPSGSVWTFNVGPDSVYGERCGFNFDAFGILKTGRDLADWKLRVVNVPVAP